MERKDLLEANAAIFSVQGNAINEVASRKIKVLVVGNPANTNALIAQRNAPDLNPRQFTAMTRLDHNRAQAQLAQKTGKHTTDVKGLCIWGNHSATQYPDLHAATVAGKGALDLVVGRLAEPRQMQTLAFEYLYSEEIVFAVRPGHPLLQRPPGSVELAALTGYTAILPTLSSIIRPEVDRLLVSQGVARLPDVIESVSADFGRRYTHLTDAVWIISYGVVAVDLAEKTLVRLAVDAPESRGPVGLTQRAEMPPSVSLQILMKAIREVAAKEG